jgi:hypothetical protein
MSGAFGFVTGLTLACAPLSAQRPPQIRLRPADRVAGARFTRATSLRELNDGRVLVGDAVERRLYLLDWEREEPTVVGRVGDGPGEYRGIGWLHPLAGDSTLFTDSANRRWLLLDGGRIVETLRRGPLGGLRASNVSGTDTLGHVLGLLGYSRTERSIDPMLADSTTLVLVTRGTGRRDTISYLEGGGGQAKLEPSSGGRPALVIGGNPLASFDQALLLQDGWIAVAHGRGYRADWRKPNGEWIYGPALKAQVVAVDDREKCAAWRRWFGTERPCTPDAIPGWPAVLPPFLSKIGKRSTPPLIETPDGLLLVYRTPSSESQDTRYDLIDRSGALVGELLMDERQSLIGAGKKSVYSLTRDETGLETLSRHRWR